MWKLIAPIFALTACAALQAPAPALPELSGNICLGAANAYAHPHLSERQRNSLLEMMRENDCFVGPQPQ